METALIAGDVAFRQHAGGHTTGPNWPTFLTFASRYLTVGNAVQAAAFSRAGSAEASSDECSNSCDRSLLDV